MTEEDTFCNLLTKGDTLFHLQTVGHKFYHVMTVKDTLFKLLKFQKISILILVNTKKLVHFEQTC